MHLQPAQRAGAGQDRQNRLLPRVSRSRHRRGAHGAEDQQDVRRRFSAAGPFVDPHRHHGDADLHGPDRESLYSDTISLLSSHFAQDLWNICRILGIQQFVEQGFLQREMVAEISRAARLDRKEAHNADAELLKSGLTRQASGKMTHALEANFQWITDLRQWCSDYVIRRTVQSRDYKNEPISGVTPYREHLICMALFPAESEAHERMIQDFLDSSASESVKNRRVRAMAVLDGRLRTDL